MTESAFNWFIGTSFCLLGAIFGSGMTALSWRLPRGESWANGRSRCPNCNHVLGPLELVPVLSWLLARGRCRFCGVPVSARYPAIELSCALWSVLAWAKLGLVPALAPVLLWGYLLVALFVIDMDFQLLPDALTLPGTLLALVASYLAHDALHSLYGIIVGAGYLWLFMWIWRTFLKRDGMGGGDIKLGAMFGALLGPFGAFLAITIAAFGGSLIGALLMARGKGGMRTALPFGAFLCPAAMIAYLWGQGWIDAYLRLAGYHPQ
ncbi:MAG: prepilin peptidase [Candidatus Eisenbacteria bacterium]|nr:prepilin peptidase [Candidatus Eisenbacteria bacterium]